MKPVNKIFYYIKQGSIFKFMDTIKSESMDLIITDPPYESLEKYRKMGTTTRLKHSKSSSNDWFSIISNGSLGICILQMLRILKNNSHMYMFCDYDTLCFIDHFIKGINTMGLSLKPLIWDKMSIGMGYHYRAMHEFVAYITKGKHPKQLNDLGIGDILRFKRIKGKKIDGREIYPTEKPVGIMKVLIEQSSNPRQIVLDPFMGSGSVGVAALQLGRSFIGCDIKSKAFNLTKERLKLAIGQK